MTTPATPLSAAARNLPPVISTIHPFATIAGSALSTVFRSSGLAPIGMPLTEAISASYYHHAVFDAFFAHIQTEKLHSRSGVGWYGDNNSSGALGKLGSLDTRYMSLLQQTQVYPVGGSIEMADDTHRAACGLRVSLWDAARRPLSLLYITGPRHRAESTWADRSVAPFTNTSTNTSSCHAPTRDFGHVALGVPFDLDSGLVAQTVLFPAPSESNAVMHGAHSDAVPPWLIDDAIAKHATSIAAKFNFFESSSPRLVLCAHNSAMIGDIEYDKTAGIVGPLPKFWSQFRIPPWKREAGKPYLSSQPCMKLNLQLIQNDHVVVHGIFYFTNEVCA